MRKIFVLIENSVFVCFARADDFTPKLSTEENVGKARYNAPINSCGTGCSRSAGRLPFSLSLLTIKLEMITRKTPHHGRSTAALSGCTLLALTTPYLTRKHQVVGICPRYRAANVSVSLLLGGDSVFGWTLQHLDSLPQALV